MSSQILFLSRQWLTAIAADYAARLGIGHDALNQKAAQDAVALLTLAPWHFRILAGGVELLASFWCWVYRLSHESKPNAAQEMAAFEKIPVIAAPLMRLYRSLVAIGWFDDADILAHYGITEPPEARQERFRRKRGEAA